MRMSPRTTAVALALLGMVHPALALLTLSTLSFTVAFVFGWQLLERSG